MTLPRLFFCLPHSAAVTNTFYESRLERTARPFLFRLYHQEKSNTNKFWLPGKLSFCIWYDTPSRLVCPFPLLFISFFPPFPSLPSLSLLSFSPHPSHPLLRVSGRLFFLCLLLMKGRTKLPSLCPCVVGKFTSVLCLCRSSSSISLLLPLLRMLAPSLPVVLP